MRPENGRTRNARILLQHRVPSGRGEEGRGTRTYLTRFVDVSVGVNGVYSSVLDRSREPRLPEIRVNGPNSNNVACQGE